MTRPTPDPMGTHRLLKLNRAWRRIAVCALAVGAMALVIGFVGALLSTLNDRRALTRATAALAVVRVQQTRQHYQLVEACGRLNVQRAEANLSGYADFLVDRMVLIFSSPDTAATAQERSFEHSFLPQLRYAVRAKEWTPLTNCTRAVAVSGAAFRASRPIPFIVQRPPPSALDSDNAQLPAPVGSR